MRLGKRFFWAFSSIEGQKESPLAILLQQIVNPLLIILLVGAAISDHTVYWVDTIAIIAIVTINATISIILRIKAEHSLATLSEMAAAQADVRRNGDWPE